MSPSQSSRQFPTPDATSCDPCYPDALKEYINLQNKKAATYLGDNSHLSANKDRSCGTCRHESDFETSSQDETIATERLKKTILSLLGAATKTRNPPPAPAATSTMLDFTSWMDLALDLLHSEELRDAVANWVREQLPHGISRVLSRDALKSDKDDLSSTWDVTKSITSGISGSLKDCDENCSVTGEKIDGIQSTLQSLLRNTIADKAHVPPARTIRPQSGSAKSLNCRELCEPLPTKSQTTQTSPLFCGPVWRFHQCFDATRETQTHESVEPPTKSFVFKPYRSDRSMCEAFSVMTRASQTLRTLPHQWSPRVNSRRSRMASETLTMTTKRFTFRPCRTAPSLCVATALLSRATQTPRPYLEDARRRLPPRGAAMRADPRHYTLSIPRNMLYHPMEDLNQRSGMEIEYCSCPRRDYDYSDSSYQGERDLDDGDTAEHGNYHLQRFAALPPLPPPPSPRSRRSFRPATQDPDVHAMSVVGGSRASQWRYPAMDPAPAPSRARSRHQACSRGAMSEALPRPVTRGAPVDIPRQPPPRVGGNASFLHRLENNWNSCNDFYKENYLSRNPDLDQGMLPHRRHPHTADEVQTRDWYNRGPPDTLSEDISNSQPWKEFQTFDSSEWYKRSGISSRKRPREDKRHNIAQKYNFQSHLAPSRFCTYSPKRAEHWTEMNIHKTEETQTFQNKTPYNRHNYAEKHPKEFLDSQGNILNDSIKNSSGNGLDIRRFKVPYHRRERSLTSVKGKGIPTEILSEFSEEMLPSSHTDEIVEEQNALSAMESPSTSLSSCEDSRIYFAHDQNLGYKTTAQDSELLAPPSEKEISEPAKSKRKGHAKSISTRRMAKSSYAVSCNASKTKSNQDTSLKCKTSSSCDRYQERKRIRRSRRRTRGYSQAKGHWCTVPSSRI